MRQSTCFVAGLVLIALLLSTCRTSAVRELQDVQGRPFKNPSSRVRLRLKQQSAERLTDTQLSALRSPMTVAIMTNHYFGSEYARTVDNCSLRDIPLNCSFVPKPDAPLFENAANLSRRADAVWWHAPNTCYMPGGPWGVKDSDPWSPFKARPEQLAVIASMESSAYYKCLDDEIFMSQFDVDMTYRLKADVPLFYWGSGYRETWEQLPPVPLAEKKDAVAFINSNCQTPSKRNEIVAGLQSQAGVRVDALGACLNGGLTLPRGPGAKFDTFRQYRYCIAIENSIAEDYVSEKVYDALAAGCVPIYLGAPNIADFVPTIDAVIDYQKFGSPAALAAELRRLSANDTAYQEKLAWREGPETWGASFRDIVRRADSGVHTQCQLCQVVAKHRLEQLNPQGNSTFLRHRNATWTPFVKPKRFSINYQLADAQPPPVPPKTVREVVAR